MLFQTKAEPKLEELTLSRRVESMPRLPISADGPLGEGFLARGCIDFHDAVRYVRDLPWGRPSAQDAATMLAEGKGTASDKHFLLASLARELGDYELQLVLGIYRLSADSSPAAAGVLSEANLQSLPDALVWLRWYGGDYDFSSMRAGGRSVVVLQEEVVTLDKLPDYAEQRHKDFLVRFLLSSRRKDLPDLRAMWSLREQVLDAVIAEQEAFRQAELALAQEVAEAQAQARDRLVSDAEEAAEAAQQEIRDRAAAAAERRKAYEESMARREAEAAEREKASVARGPRSGRRKTRRAPGQRTEEMPAIEETEEEASVRKSTRRAPTGKLAEESGEGTSRRKRTRRAPGQRTGEVEAVEKVTAEPEEATQTRRRRTRKAPKGRLTGEVAAVADPDAAEGKEAVAPEKEEAEEPKAATPSRRKRTRKAPTARKAAEAEAEDEGNAKAGAKAKADTKAEANAKAKAKEAPKAEAKEAPQVEAKEEAEAEKKPAPRKRKRTRRAPGKK